jgi:hypothetical protein
VAFREKRPGQRWKCVLGVGWGGGCFKRSSVSSLCRMVMTPKLYCGVKHNIYLELSIKKLKEGVSLSGFRRNIFGKGVEQVNKS